MLGRDAYFADPAPWNFTENGWIARPIVFVLVSMIVARLMQEYVRTLNERATNASRAQEIKVLSLIDRMILSGTSEEDSSGRYRASRWS